MARAPFASDSASQAIVAAEVTQSSTDSKQLAPMPVRIEKNLERKPGKASADAGYFGEANVNDEAVTGIDLYIATGRDKHGDPRETAIGDAPPGSTSREQMRHKKTEIGRAVYKMRSQQSAEAVPRRLDSASGIKSPRKRLSKPITWLGCRESWRAPDSDEQILCRAVEPTGTAVLPESLSPTHSWKLLIHFLHQPVQRLQMIAKLV